MAKLLLSKYRGIYDSTSARDFPFFDVAVLLVLAEPLEVYITIDNRFDIL